MRNRVLAVVLALVLAVVGVIAILAYVRSANLRAVEGLKAETVVVANGAIPAGTTVDEASAEHLLRTEDVPVSSLANAGPPVHGVTAANGPLVITSALAKDQVLFAGMLAEPGSAAASEGGLAVPAHMIAVAIDACLPEDVAGYVSPGADVAVFSVLIPDGAVEGETPACSSDHAVLGRNALAGVSADLVLPSAEVLAVGQKPGSEGAAGSSASETQVAGEVVVTLAVTAQQAGELMVLQQAGIPYLALPGADAGL